MPKFWADIWFVQVENKFRLQRITSETRQYEHRIDALPPQAKEALVTHLVASEARRLRLSEEVLGDRRSTQFLRHLQQLLEDKATTLDTAVLQ